MHFACELAGAVTGLGVVSPLGVGIDAFWENVLAERVAVSRKTINTVENGVFVPSTTLALKLARALGCRVEDIFQLDNPN